MADSIQSIMKDLRKAADKGTAVYFAPDAVAALEAALGQPVPPAPTVMEIVALADEIEEAGLGQVDLVRAALARWGTSNLAEARSSLDACQSVAEDDIDLFLEQ